MRLQVKFAASSEIAARRARCCSSSLALFHGASHASTSLYGPAKVKARSPPGCGLAAVPAVSNSMSHRRPRR